MVTKTWPIFRSRSVISDNLAVLKCMSELQWCLALLRLLLIGLLVAMPVTVCEGRWEWQGKCFDTHDLKMIVSLCNVKDRADPAKDKQYGLRGWNSITLIQIFNTILDTPGTQIDQGWQICLMTHGRPTAGCQARYPRASKMVLHTSG